MIVSMLELTMVVVFVKRSVHCGALTGWNFGVFEKHLMLVAIQEYGGHVGRFVAIVLLSVW